MTGKRPRALTRTASVSQLSSGSLSQQEFSPLRENPKEKLKPTINSGGSSSPRVVIGFDPKPCLEAASAPCSPSFNDKASSPRSVLNSLFSRQRTKPTTEGVGLGIVLHASPEDINIVVHADHIAIPVRDEISVPVVHPRRHSHPIPTPGISPCHSQCAAEIVPKGSKQQRPILGWLDQDVLKVDRRDTFLLAPSPARASFDVAAAFTASASHFLDECSFCKRYLPKDKDIFMYRGDKAFCSVECRSQQMLMDERSKNCSSSAVKRRSVVPSTVAAA